VRGRAERVELELRSVPHLWALIAVVYSYLALFALLVVLTISGH
jgi:hypothetical protein